MTDAQPDPERWSDEAKDAFVRAADALSTALRTHAVAVSAAGSDADAATITIARDALAVALEAYDEAQYDYSGTFPPFAIIEEEGDDETDHDHAHAHDGEAIADEDVTGVTVLQRMDYRIINPKGVLAAGQMAQRLSDGEIDGPVTDLGEALYALAHSHGPGGWNRLSESAGIEPVAHVALAVANEGLLPTDPDAWPDDSLSVEEGELLFQEGATWVE